MEQCFYKLPIKGPQRAAQVVAGRLVLRDDRRDGLVGHQRGLVDDVPVAHRPVPGAAHGAVLHVLVGGERHPEGGQGRRRLAEAPGRGLSLGEPVRPHRQG